MMVPTAGCPHASVASHGVEPGDPSRDGTRSEGEYEMGWCRGCSEYVHRELGGAAWSLRPGYEHGAWMWRDYGRRPVGRG
jgi:hypothetical protein